MSKRERLIRSFVPTGLSPEDAVAWIPRASRGSLPFSPQGASLEPARAQPQAAFELLLEPLG